jgi:DNA-binding MarR family transcriptional regulator
MSSAEPTIAPESIAESLHASAIHLLRRLRRLDDQPARTDAFLNAPRLSALSVIVFSGPITLGRLAAAEQVRPPTMTRIVHALAAADLVVKSPGPGDRRTVRLSSTMKGKRLLLQRRNRRIGALAAQIAALSAANQAALGRALPILRRLSS